MKKTNFLILWCGILISTSLAATECSRQPLGDITNRTAALRQKIIPFDIFDENKENEGAIGTAPQHYRKSKKTTGRPKPKVVKELFPNPPQQQVIRTTPFPWQVSIEYEFPTNAYGPAEKMLREIRLSELRQQILRQKEQQAQGFQVEDSLPPTVLTETIMSIAPTPPPPATVAAHQEKQHKPIRKAKKTSHRSSSILNEVTTLSWIAAGSFVLGIASKKIYDLLSGK